MYFHNTTLHPSSFFWMHCLALLLQDLVIVDHSYVNSLYSRLIYDTGIDTSRIGLYTWLDDSVNTGSLGIYTKIWRKLMSYNWLQFVCTISVHLIWNLNCLVNRLSQRFVVRRVRRHESVIRKRISRGILIVATEKLSPCCCFSESFEVPKRA